MLELLVVIPFLHFALIYIASKLKGTTDKLWGIYAIKYLDWFFVPLNFLVPFAVIFNLKLFLISVGSSLFFIIVLHKRWKVIKDPKSPSKFFIGKNGMTIEGWIHFIFMCIQTSIIITVFVSVPINSFYYILMLNCIAAYIVGYLLIIRYVRKVAIASKAEAPFLLVGLLLVVLRTIFILI
jgi:hypothetical protein